MKTAFLSIGSNVGNRKRNLDRVTELLEENGVTVTELSPIYETEPYGYKEQEWFYNQVLKVDTDLSPHDLLALCQRIEVEIGRQKTFKLGPRVIDIDILSYEGEVSDDENLTIPHPFLHMRMFVLRPLNDIDGSAVVFGLEKTVNELLNECNDTSIVRRLN